MDASPLLVRVLAALRDRKLEAVLIGNAAAALHGTPVTTLCFDFLFRETTTNLAKLKRVVKDCDAMIPRPFYPVSKLYHVVNDNLGLQADFMPMIHGIRSYEGVRARATQRMIGGFPLIVASLDDVIASKKADHSTECHSAATGFNATSACRCRLAVCTRRPPATVLPLWFAAGRVARFPEFEIGHEQQIGGIPRVVGVHDMKCSPAGADGNLLRVPHGDAAAIGQMDHERLKRLVSQGCAKLLGRHRSGSCQQRTYPPTQ